MPITFYLLLVIGLAAFLWVMYICVSRLNYLIHKQTDNPNNEALNQESFYKEFNDYKARQENLLEQYKNQCSKYEVELLNFHAEINSLKREGRLREAMYSFIIKSIIHKYERRQPYSLSGQSNFITSGILDITPETPKIKYSPSYNIMEEGDFYATQIIKN